jgi:glycosyltransferase involved in cell wall biosynthesis
MKRVVLCGTHPAQYNGYSKVVYELSKGLVEHDDIELYIFGFQNFFKNETHKMERHLVKVKDVYDAYDHEEPKAKGFGEKIIKDYVSEVDPDIVIIYNDLVVITSLIKQLILIPNRRFKIVPYIDIVYKNEKNLMISNINNNIDGGIMFTEHWKTHITEQGLTKPLYVLEHGFNPDVFYPIPKKIARKFFNINEDEYVIVNLNRNQPRKRWDICLMAFIKFISKRIQEKIKLLIATNMNGGWDLFDIMISECRKNNITFEDLKKHLIIIQNPQQITDREINVLYNVGDIGINTCDGEGFGLCNFEQAGVGVPQIVPKLGGFQDYLNKSCALMINPKWTYYCDHSRDYVSGEAEVCEVNDFVEALEYYYTNEVTRQKHGMKCRGKILKEYKWMMLCDKLHEIITRFTKDTPPRKKADTDEVINTDTDIDIDSLIEHKLNGIYTDTDTNTTNEGQSHSHSDEDDEIIIIEGGA